MNLVLQRTAYKDFYTIGKVTIVGEFWHCDTLEPKYRDLEKEGKILGQTAIPKGKYKIKIVWSTKFNKNVPLLLDVSDFESIEMHIGNTPADTRGCILVGQNTQEGKLTSSTLTFNSLMDILQTAKDDIYIEVI